MSRIQLAHQARDIHTKISYFSRRSITLLSGFPLGEALGGVKSQCKNSIQFLKTVLKILALSFPSDQGLPSLSGDVQDTTLLTPEQHHSCIPSLATPPPPSTP